MTDTATALNPQDVTERDTPEDVAEHDTPTEGDAQSAPPAGGLSNVETPEPETFPREYVEKLRAEAAESRTKAKDRDTLAAALWQAHVAATGKMADPTDLPMPAGADPTDTEAITAAVDALLAAKPHLASRTPRGNIGQGATTGPTTFDLLAALRANAS